MVLVFGATGFTGRMVVDDLVERGVPVRIAGRSQERLERLSERHGGLEIAIADVKDPPSISRAAAGTSVLVTTVGPYSWWGEIAADAAIEHDIPYIDITGEPAFIREIFDDYGPRAAAAGIPFLTAMGYDYVPGNLAGALALQRAEGRASRVDIGYFLTAETSRNLKSLSGGTLRSLRASGSAMQFAWRGGRLVEEPGAKRVIKFEIGDHPGTAISIGSTEHLSLPRIFPELAEVNVGLGWFGGASRAVSLISNVNHAVESLPLIGGAAKRAVSLFEQIGAKATGSRNADSKPAGPEQDTRDRSRARIVAVARDAAGKQLTEVALEGPNPYDLTGRLVGWAAQQADIGAIGKSGALGPVEAFGIEALSEACASFGLSEA